MQLKDVLTLAAREGVRRYVEKRAGIALPLAVGAMIPGIAHKAMERAHSTEKQLDHAEYEPMKLGALPPWLAMSLAQMGAPNGPIGRAGNAIGGAASSAGKTMGGGAKASLGAIGGSVGGGVAGGISGGISDMIKRKMHGPEFGEKKDPLHMGAGEAVKMFGKEMGTSGANLLRDIANKAMEAAGHAGDASARQAIIGDLKQTDSVLANADDTTLMEAYHTMTRFAPVLSTDKNAVRSFLRQAVMSGSGPDFMSIKLLADSERAVTGGNDKRAAFNASALEGLLPSLGRGALMGGGVGAVSGALADKDDRVGGAMRGALGGAAAGGLGGALHQHLNGPTQPVNPYKPAIQYNDGQGTVQAGPGWARWNRAPEAPTHQGFTQGVTPNHITRDEWPLAGLRNFPDRPAGNTGGPLKNLKYDPHIQGDATRWVTPPVQDLARDLEKLQLPGG